MTTAATPRVSTARAAVVLVIACAVAILVNTVVAVAAVALGAPTSYGPLTFPAYATFSVLGIAVGWVGWRVVRARARDPRRTLARLVPVVAVLSFVPDVVLLATGFIPGTRPAAVVALMIMHVVVLACAVPAYALLSPVPARP